MKKSFLIAFMASLMLFAVNLGANATDSAKNVMKTDEKDAVMIDDTKMQEQNTEKSDKRAQKEAKRLEKEQKKTS